MLELLIVKGANLNIKGIQYQNIRVILSNSRKWHKLKRTPLHYAAEKNLKELLEILIAKGADINAKDLNYYDIIILFLINQIYNL